MATSSDPSSVLIALEQKLAAAWVDRDRGFIEGLLAPEWSVIDTTGRVLTRADVLDEAFGSAERSIVSMSVDDLQVRLLGTVAVVTGVTRATGSYRGEAASITLRFTDVFHERDGRWTIVASQGTVVPPAA